MTIRPAVEHYERECPIPARAIAGVAIPDTRLLNSAMAYVSGMFPDFVYNHAMRTLLFSFLIAEKDPAMAGRDAEVHALAAVLHDLGWDPTPPYEPKDPRFRFDGAGAARNFLISEHSEHHTVVPHIIREQSSPSAATHEDRQVRACHFGIRAEQYHRKSVPEGVTQEEYDAVVEEFPRVHYKSLKKSKCQLCSLKLKLTETGDE